MSRAQELKQQIAELQGMMKEAYYSRSRGTPGAYNPDRWAAADMRRGQDADREFRNQERNAGLEDEENNLQISINGKRWKVIPGRGKADSFEERSYLQNMQKWAERKSAATGKKWTVSLTGAPVSEGLSEGYAEGEDVESFKNSLHTIVRVASHLEKNIADDEHFEEWVVEKVGAAKAMIVAVMDYMISSHEQQNGDRMDNADSVDKANLELGMNEWKKSHKAPIKPRNFVAKNATTGGAGAHKDKKKAAKQGETKHKKKPELAESSTYDRRLNVLLESKVLTEKIRQYRK